MATTPGYSGMDWFNEERRLIEVGKLYGYKQSGLRTFVQNKLAELKDERAERSRIERDERTAERAHALIVLEMKAKEKPSPESKVLACENKTKKWRCRNLITQWTSPRIWSCLRQ